MIRWNKSFPMESVVYGAASNDAVQIGHEALPNKVMETGHIEAVRAPYQRSEVNPRFGDILFFWST